MRYDYTFTLSCDYGQVAVVVPNAKSLKGDNLNPRFLAVLLAEHDFVLVSGDNGGTGFRVKDLLRVAYTETKEDGDAPQQ